MQNITEIVDNLPEGHEVKIVIARNEEAYKVKVGIYKLDVQEPFAKAEVYGEKDNVNDMIVHLCEAIVSCIALLEPNTDARPKRPFEGSVVQEVQARIDEQSKHQEPPLQQRKGHIPPNPATMEPTIPVKQKTPVVAPNKQTVSKTPNPKIPSDEF